MKSIKNINKIIITAILFLLGFCLIAVLLNVFSLHQLPASFIGATLGALITVIITNILLKSQTESEEEKERSIKVFEKKSPIFQGYIKRLWKIWSYHIVTSEEYEELLGLYYSDLLIYLSDKISKEISGCLVNIGKYVDEETYGNEYIKLRGNIINIINLLSEEINLGGQIIEENVNEMDKQIFPVLFKSKLIKAFNVALKVNNDIFNDGEFQEWNETKNLVHECISFSFIEYPGICIKYLFSDNKITALLIVPNGAKYKKFLDFRDTGIMSQRIKYEKCWINILDPDEDNKLKITPFNFRTKDNLENISNENYHSIVNVLAKRGANFVSDTKIKIFKDGQPVDISIIEFLEYIYKG